MKVLVIYSHQNPKSFSNEILNVVVSEFKGKGHEVDVRDLYAIGFDPVLSVADFEKLFAGTVSDDVKIEQDYIRNADLLVFIHPIWWASMGAVMKGYIDRVFSMGFAYKYTAQGPEGLLNGKKAMLINNMGSPFEFYDKIGMIDAFKMTLDKGIFGFCGIDVVEHIFNGGVPSASEDQKKQYLDGIKTSIHRISQG